MEIERKSDNSTDDFISNGMFKTIANHTLAEKVYLLIDEDDDEEPVDNTQD